MPENLFRGLFDTDMTQVIPVGDFLLCVVSALAIGLILALAYMHRTRCTKSFVATLALLPAVVCVVIMMVNGNVGTGVVVAGTFSLVRFRSVPGTAKEIGIIFLAMGAGLICGMGYLAYAFLFARGGEAGRPVQDPPHHHPGGPGLHRGIRRHPEKIRCFLGGGPGQDHQYGQPVPPHLQPGAAAAGQGKGAY